MSDILSGCQEARGMTTIEEIDCPKCGGVIEVFERDGLTVGDSVCEQCGCVIPGDVHLSLYLEEVSKVKISVCGKGGSGKSTIVALLAERLAKAGKEVLIIDSDESNYGCTVISVWRIQRNLPGFSEKKRKS